MFIWLILLTIALVIGAITGVIMLVRAYRRGISRTVFIVGIVLTALALCGAAASAVGAHAVGPAPAVEEVDVGDVPQEELIPNVDQLVDLNQIVIDERFGDYSRYVLRSSWPNLAKVRTHYSGFSDAVSLPMAVDQAWFDAYQEWGPHGQTVSNPDGTTTTISDYDDINAALQTREDYLAGLSEEELFHYYREEIYEEILRNPIYGDMVARFFLEDELITANNQEWLQDFVDQMDAAYAAPDDQAQGIECWIQYDPNHPSDSKYLMTTDEYYQYAVRLCLVLEYYLDEGVSSPTADEHYCLPPDAEVTQARTEKADYTEDEEAFILVYKTKDGQVVDRIGFNLLDRRIERPKPAEPEPEPTDTPDKPTPPPDKPTPTEPVKDPADDPAQQGNADVGGGANQPGDGKGDRQDYEEEREQDQDYKPSNNTGDRGDNGSSHETVTDSQGGHTDNGTPPDTSQPKDPERADPATGTETTVKDNGDGTTTTTTTEADASKETADGVLAMPD